MIARHQRYAWWCCPPSEPTQFLAGTLDRPGELRLVLRAIAQFPIVSGPVVSPDGSTMAVERPLFGGDQDWLFLPLEGMTRPCSHHGYPAPAGRFGSGPNCRGATIVTEDWIIGGLAGWAPA